MRSFLLRAFFQLQSVVALPLVRVLLRLTVRGKGITPTPRGLILAPNHQSWLDPIVVQVAVYPHRITFLMTELYYDLPVLGLYFRAAGARVVREEGPSVAGLRAAMDALEEGEIICVFPEGEITRTGELGRGHRGVARLARRTGAPVVPIGVRGAIRVWSKIQKIPQLRPVSIHIGKPLTFRVAEGERARKAEEDFTARLMRSIAVLCGAAK